MTPSHHPASSSVMGWCKRVDQGVQLLERPLIAAPVLFSIPGVPHVYAAAKTLQDLASLANLSQAQEVRYPLWMSPNVFILLQVGRPCWFHDRCEALMIHLLILQVNIVRKQMQCNSTSTFRCQQVSCLLADRQAASSLQKFPPCCHMNIVWLVGCSIQPACSNKPPDQATGGHCTQDQAATKGTNSPYSNTLSVSVVTTAITVQRMVLSSYYRL